MLGSIQGESSQLVSGSQWRTFGNDVRVMRFDEIQ